MITLETDRLVFRFPEVHREAEFSISFQRTLRIPDDGTDYPLPPALGAFPLRHVDDFADRLPKQAIQRGGVILPMYQAEAMWLSFSAGTYPFAVKVATGKINAVNGGPWSQPLNGFNQDYMVVPEQPWLDGYCIEKGVIRQFVAAPHGMGITVEEQLTGDSTWGGIQILAYPLKATKFAEIEAQRVGWACLRSPDEMFSEKRESLGLGPGGRMRQHIYEDPYAMADWDQERGSRCFVTILDSVDWTHSMGEPMPTRPVSASDYAAAGLPWFDFNSGGSALDGSKGLGALKSIGQSWAGTPLGGSPLQTPVEVKKVVRLGRRPVREMND